jgi:hypothetical protein
LTLGGKDQGLDAQIELQNFGTEEFNWGRNTPI